MARKLDKEKVIAQAKSGDSASAIARENGVSVSNIARILRDAGFVSDAGNITNGMRSKMPEEINIVVSYPWIGVANDGRVFNMNTERELKPRKKKNSSRIVLSKDGKLIYTPTQRLICEANTGVAPSGCIAAPIDGDYWNFTPSNWEWRMPGSNLSDEDFVRMWQSCYSLAEARQMIGSNAVNRAKALRDRGVKLKCIARKSSVDELNSIIDEQV